MRAIGALHFQLQHTCMRCVPEDAHMHVSCIGMSVDV